MASSRPRGGSFSRNISSAATAQIPGVKLGPNGTSFLSSGIPDLDRNSHYTSFSLFFFVFFVIIISLSIITKES